jgi:hypothetical protein
MKTKYREAVDEAWTREAKRSLSGRIRAVRRTRFGGSCRGSARLRRAALPGP